MEHWQDSPREATEVAWDLAPRQSASAPWSYPKPIPEQKDIRMQEVYLLAGSLFSFTTRHQMHHLGFGIGIRMVKRGGIGKQIRRRKSRRRGD
jgi:hypothetical protein